MSERDPKIPDLVSKAEAAEILGISHQAVQQMVDKGRLRGAKIGSTWVFRRAAVLAFRSEPPQSAAAAQMEELQDTLAQVDAFLAEHDPQPPRPA
jgi:excisionase family DNA binding protein